MSELPVTGGPAWSWLASAAPAGGDLLTQSVLTLLLATFVAALITDLATGLGALPFAFVPNLSDRLQGALTALAAGMMTIASVIQLLNEGMDRAPGWEIWQPCLGMLLGGAFFLFATDWIERHEEFDVLNLRRTSGAGALLIVAAMTIHSLPEGVAIGVAYGSNEAGFGLSVATALAIHNIPEGVAITAALRGRGVGLWACALWAVLSSVPQPLAAPPAAWAVWISRPLLPAGLGFAAGAMMFLVANELIPESAERAGAARAAAWFVGGLVLMTFIARGVELIHF